MSFDKYRSACHGTLVVPFLHTEQFPPPKKIRPLGQIIIFRCAECRRMCSIKKEEE